MCDEKQQSDIMDILKFEIEKFSQEPKWSLVDWFLGKISRIDAARTELKKRYKELMNHCDSEERSLWYLRGEHFRAEAIEQLTASGKKTIKTLNGTIKFRKTKGRLEIVNNGKAVKWAIENLPANKLIDAVSTLRKTPLLEGITLSESVDESTGEAAIVAENVPDGCVYHPAVDMFYPREPARKLFNAGDQKDG